MKKRLSGHIRTIPFCHKPQMDRIKEVEAERKIRKRINKRRMNYMKFHGIQLSKLPKGTIKVK